MQVDACGDSSLNKRFAQAVLAEDNERNRPLDARAAPRFFFDEVIRGSRKRRLAHVFSVKRALDFPWCWSGSIHPGEFCRAVAPSALMLAEALFVVE